MGHSQYTLPKLCKLEILLLKVVKDTHFKANIA